MIIIFTMLNKGLSGYPMGPSGFNHKRKLMSVHLEQRNIFYFHGLGGSCKQNNSNIFTCIETGAGFLDSADNIEKQASEGCLKLIDIIYDENGNIRNKYEFGFHFMGQSQGGLIARSIFHTCKPVRPYIKRIVTIGTPNLGINRLPEFEGLSRINELGLFILESLPDEYGINRWSFYDYLNKKENSKRVMSPLIDKLLTSSESDDETYESLEAMINVMFTQDEFVHPYTSSSFGVDYEPIRKLFSSIHYSPIADRMGIGKLAEKDRFVSCSADARHLQLSTDQTTDLYTFLSDSYNYSYFEGEEIPYKKLYDDNFEDMLGRFPPKDLICSWGQNKRRQIEWQSMNIHNQVI